MKANRMIAYKLMRDRQKGKPPPPRCPKCSILTRNAQPCTRADCPTSEKVKP